MKSLCENLTFGKIAIVLMIIVCSVCAYRSYSHQIKLKEALGLLGPYKLAINLCIIDNGTRVGCNANTQSIPANYSNVQGPVKNIMVKDGEIVLVSNLSEDPLRLTPNYKNGRIEWISNNAGIPGILIQALR